MSSTNQTNPAYPIVTEASVIQNYTRLGEAITVLTKTPELVPLVLSLGALNEYVSSEFPVSNAADSFQSGLHTVAANYGLVVANLTRRFGRRIDTTTTVVGLGPARAFSRGVPDTFPENVEFGQPGSGGSSANFFSLGQSIPVPVDDVRSIGSSAFSRGSSVVGGESGPAGGTSGAGVNTEGVDATDARNDNVVATDIPRDSVTKLASPGKSMQSVRPGGKLDNDVVAATGLGYDPADSQFNNFSGVVEDKVPTAPKAMRERGGGAGSSSASKPRSSTGTGALVSSGSEAADAIGGYRGAAAEVVPSSGAQDGIREWVRTIVGSQLPKRCKELALVTRSAALLGSDAQVAQTMLAVIGDTAAASSLAIRAVLGGVAAAEFQTARNSAFSNAAWGRVFVSSGLSQFVVAPNGINFAVGRAGGTMMEATVGMIAARIGVRALRPIVDSMLKSVDVKWETQAGAETDQVASGSDSGNWSDMVEEDELSDKVTKVTVQLREWIEKVVGCKMPTKAPELDLVVWGAASRVAGNKEAFRMLAAAGSVAIPCAYAAHCYRNGIPPGMFQQYRGETLATAGLATAYRRGEMMRFVVDASELNWSVDGTAARAMQALMGLLLVRMDIRGVDAACKALKLYGGR